MYIHVYVFDMGSIWGVYEIEIEIEISCTLTPHLLPRSNTYTCMYKQYSFHINMGGLH
jgi:hypothetical protein